jgi:DNA adenine methylase
MKANSLLQRTKPALRWPGGKSRLLKHILPLIREHTCYCEPFAGGLAVLLAKPRSPVEIINDLNGEIVALYRCVQFHLPELLRELAALVSSRKMMKDFVGQSGVTDIQRAARFYYRNRVSFGGGMTSYGVTRSRGGGAGFLQQTNRDLLGPIRDRLDGVMIENLTYERCLELYDGPETLFFLDPPYLDSDGGAYAGWTREQMSAFRKRVATLRGRWIVTVDDSPFNRDLFAGCRMDAFESRNGAAKATARVKFKEMIVTP